MAVVDFDLVDEELCRITVPSRQLVGEHEADRLFPVERDEEERGVVPEQVRLRRPRRERLDHALVAEPESADDHSANAASRSFAGAFR